MAAVAEDSDWFEWHDRYNDPRTGLARRLRLIQERIKIALDDAPPGPLRAISICAGQGTDLIGALADHPRRGDVTARLVELDPRNTQVARRLAAAADLDGVEVVTGDAALAGQYAGMVPAHLVIACGVFGNLSNADIEATIGYCPQLCATGGVVVWTRGRWDPDLSPQICAWFEERAFERVWLNDLSGDPEFGHRVGVHRFTGTQAPLDESAVMFTFIGHDIHTGPRR
jgi:Putative methyltransferase